MADRTLLIPGTQATSLQDQNGTVVYNAVRVGLGLNGDELGGRPPEEWGRVMGVQTPPDGWAPSRTSLEPGTAILPHSVVGAAYDRMMAFADPWPYDWRLDMRHNARQLLDFMRANKPANGRFNLIGHSQGGLVIVLASKLTFDLNEFSRLVARVILVGCPLAGTMRATEALLWGSEGLGSDRAKEAREMAVTWPALYQMLPSWRAVEKKKDEPLGEEVQFLQPGGWPPPFDQGIQADLLKRGREAAALLAGPLARFGTGTMSMSFLGKRQMTPVALRRTAAGLPDDRSAMRNQQGDSLVPYAKTLAWGGTAFADQVVALTGKPNAHGMLCNDLEVLDMTQRFLEAPAPPAPTAPPASGPGGGAG